MSGDKKPVDYVASINRARRKRNRPPYGKYAAAVLVCVAAAGIFFGVRAIRTRQSNEPAALTNEAGESGKEENEESINQEESLAEALRESEEQKAKEEEEKKEKAIDAVLDSYSNLGVVQVSGYLNIRKSPEAGAHVVGKLMDGSACEITETLDGWYHVTSGGIDGYVSSQYILTGEDAKAASRELVKDRALVTTDNLNIRTEPSTDSDVVGQCLEGEEN